jgi:hypothetical protein
MKKIMLYVFLIGLVLSLSNCRYDEGPVISFRTPRGRIIGTWVVTAFYKNDVDNLNSFNDSCGCTMIVQNDPDHYKISFLNCINYNGTFERPMTGQYRLKKNDTQLQIFFDNLDNNSNINHNIGPFVKSSIWDIHRLTDKELYVTTTIGNDEYRVEFKKTN